jgi:quinolinate synthase
MASNVGELPRVEFVRPCQMCPYMGTITLPKIYESLRDLKYEITVPSEIAGRARRAVERMLDVGRGRGG